MNYLDDMTVEVTNTIDRYVRGSKNAYGNQPAIAFVTIKTPMVSPKPSIKDSPNQRMWDAFNKLEVEVMRFALEKALVSLDIEFADPRYGLDTVGPIDEERAAVIAKDAKWSTYAGCTCRCSPGFKLPFRGKTIFIDVMIPTKEQEAA